MTKLTEDILRDIGFYGQGKTPSGRPTYRLKIPNYSFEIQMSLANYPEPNDNNGILSVFMKEEKDMHVISTTFNNKDLRIVFITNKGLVDNGMTFEMGIKYIAMPVRDQPIAWGVTTFERLRDIVKALTNHTITLKTKQNGNSSTIKRINRTTRKK